LLKDGVVDLEEMARCRISRQQLFAELRSKGIYNLGEVRRVYLESCGLFTAIKMQSPAPGLPTLPPGDNSVLSLLQDTDKLACCNCGNVGQQQGSRQPCKRCGANNWTTAITS
jgi:uncharacterized membrane protein YcaP (DUF421 family)